MTRGSAYALLVVLAAGVFLAGLELMITAVALPTIIRDFSSASQNPFAELRKASWIVEGYFVAYVVSMPLAGRIADVWGARRLFLVAIVVFIVGSLLAGRAQTIDELILGRIVQGIGGGILIPVGTAAASHLFEGHARPRALGIIGALTFLGMAAGPFAGAAILGGFQVGAGLSAMGVAVDDPIRSVLEPAWRWVFYFNVPIGLVALLVAWPASSGWETPRRPSGIDFVGAFVWSVALGAGLVAVTILGSQRDGGPDPLVVSGLLGILAIVATVLTIVRGTRVDDPFLDVRLFRNVTFSSAAVVSLLTGYAFATAIIGGAVFVDRVLYGGPDEQRFALGALAAATALGALVSGFAVRFLSLRIVTLVGLAIGAAALLRMATWTPEVGLGEVALTLGIFGASFGLTVTPRSTAAVEVAGRAAFGMAAATVTVARTLGMAVGVAVLTAYGSTTIDRLYDDLIIADGWKQVVPVELRDRSLRDGLVVQAIERWAAGQASSILVGLFVVAGIVTIVAVPPGIALGSRPRMLAADRAGRTAVAAGGPPEPDGTDERRTSSAL